MERYKDILNKDKEWDLPLNKNKDGDYIVIPKKRGYSGISKVHANKVLEGYVYFIRCNGTNYYKLGVSTNPYNRIQAIDSNCPQELEILSLHKLKNPYKVEQQFAELYLKYNHKKEWYIFNIDIAKEIMIKLHNLNVMQDDE